MGDISVDVVSPGGLTKERFVFTTQGLRLVYTSHWVLNRSSRIAKWPDEQPKPLEFDQWKKLPSVIKEHGQRCIDDDDEWLHEVYRRYCDTMNPVCQKTRGGKYKMGGQSAPISQMPICPHWVAEKALVLLARKMQAVYKPRE